MSALAIKTMYMDENIAHIKQNFYWVSIVKISVPPPSTHVKG